MTPEQFKALMGVHWNLFLTVSGLGIVTLVLIVYGLDKHLEAINEIESHVWNPEVVFEGDAQGKYFAKNEMIIAFLDGVGMERAQQILYHELGHHIWYDYLDQDEKNLFRLKANCTDNHADRDKDCVELWAELWEYNYVNDTLREAYGLR